MWVRLDRVCFNSAALSALPGSVVTHLTRIGSDHCPLLVQGENLEFKPQGNTLKFEDVWLEDEASNGIVIREWQKPTHGSPPTILNHKFARTLRALKSWSRDKFGDINAIAKDLESRIVELQSRESVGTGLTESELDCLLHLVAEYNTTFSRLETWWLQRAKVKWKCRDGNTSYFHKAATCRKRPNHIRRLVGQNGEEILDHEGIRAALVTHFSSKWRTPIPPSPELSIPPPRAIISDEDALRISSPVSNEEIVAAINSLGNNKAPGIDGITSSFLKGYWSVTSTNVLTVVHHFFSYGSMSKRWKDTLVVLIPKVQGAELPSQFRPSLCTTIYKVIAKLLIKRVKDVLSSLISQEQGAFVLGRGIAYNCLIAQEIMQRLASSESSTGYMSVKVDIEQAYDRMRWDFLQKMLQHFGFPDTWSRWALACVESLRFALMINGQKSSWIEATCGFRQGCPLSPYLFILCSELLSFLINQQQNRDDLLGIRTTAHGPPITHLMFADDILMFAPATCKAVRALNNIFDVYSNWSRQKINKAKSSICFSKKMKRSRKRMIANKWGFCTQVEGKYLGIPLISRRPVKADFQHIIDSVRG
ncbi:putative mitochondrial protein [Apostasia shenzhenica]|uniref:Putative mitochondrial protein n=1 Tax=Apostasia shenzhenica TaxID=1088818 RepID=A0A2H9ZTI3_9ASPA|nr:putative mitochondrial protein [Apostasia shenzhenica]